VFDQLPDFHVWFARRRVHDAQQVTYLPLAGLDNWRMDPETGISATCAGSSSPSMVSK